MHNISNLFLFWNNTICFGRSLRPSSGVEDCTYIRHMSYRFCGCLLASSHRTCMTWCCVYSLHLLMMDGETVRNM